VLKLSKGWFSSKGGDSCCSVVYLTKVRRTGVQKDLRC
jgi:hypothetical protein